MSTQALVGIENENGTVTAIYNHFDGYIDNGLGEWLYENIFEEDQLRDIISNGDASYIPAHEFYVNRGESLNIRKFTDVDDYRQEAGNYSYIYLFTADGDWMVHTSRSNWEMLEDLKVEN